MITAGIDAGAATTKVVLLMDREVIGYRITGTAFDFQATAETIYHELLGTLHLEGSAVEVVCATGYGRNAIPFANKVISEITAHTRGISLLFPGVRGIIDMGGQDSKIIVVEEGQVVDFLMNDKCAAGTGRFLEHTARALEVSVSDLGTFALQSRHPVGISSMCTVFAETEVISLRARGIAKEDIAAGLIAGIAQRIGVMAKRMGLTDQIAFVGGVAKNAGMKSALEKELGVALFVPPEPQITGALGAALTGQGHR